MATLVFVGEGTHVTVTIPLNLATDREEQRFSRTILAASIAAIWLSAPLAAQAEADDLRSLITPDSQVEVVGDVVVVKGFVHVDKDIGSGYA